MTPAGKSRPRILALDDDAALLHSLRETLDDDYEVIPATSVGWALDIVRQAAPDLGILDLELPGVSPSALMSDLAEINPAMDFIFMAPDGKSVQSVLEALREHPFYYIEKPPDPASLRVLVRRCFGKRELQQQYQRARVYKEETEEAQKLHEDLLPEDSSPIGDVTVECLYRPVFKLGGDFYDYVAQRDGTGMAFLIADITGHGFAPALLAGVLKTAFREAHDRGYDPETVIERVRRGLGVCTEQRQVTVFCGSYRAQDRTLRYCNAGHPSAFVWGSGRTPERLESNCPLIASMPGWPELQAPVRERRMAPGECLLLVTDGVYEPWAGDPERAEGEVVRAIARWPSGERGLLDGLWERIAEGLKKVEHPDDVTLMCLRF